MIRGIIFDFDGTLADSERIWYETLQHAYSDHGLILDSVRYWQSIGAPAGTFDPFEKLSKVTGLTAIELEAQLGEYVMAALVTQGPCLGVRKLLTSVRKHELLAGVASNSPGAFIEQALDGWGMRADFDVIVGRDSGLPQKPDPAVYLEALRVLGLPAREAVAVEDSANGARAAVAAGLRCYLLGAVPFRGRAGSIARIDSVESLSFAPSTGFVTNRECWR